MRHTQLALGWKQAPEGVEAPTAASAANPGGAMVCFFGVDLTGQPKKKTEHQPSYHESGANERWLG